MTGNTNRVALAISSESPLDLGGGMRDCSPIILSLDASGSRTFDRCVSAIKPGLITADGLAIDREGDLLYSGFPGSEYDVGTGRRSIDASRGGSVLLKMSGDDGTTLWSTEFLQSYARTLWVDDQNHIVTHGHIPTFDDNTRIAEDALTGCEPLDGYEYHLTWLNSEGVRLHTSLMGRVDSLVALPDGRALVTANAGVSLVPGITPRASSYVAAIDKDGRVTLLDDLVTSGNFGGNLTVDGQGAFYISGVVMGSVTLDNGSTYDVPIGYQQGLAQYELGD
jgi:hypothetical protein